MFSVQIQLKRGLTLFFLGSMFLLNACSDSGRKNNSDADSTINESYSEAIADSGNDQGTQKDTSAPQIEASGNGVGPYTQFTLGSDTINQEMAERGKEIFSEGCAPCHQTSNKIKVGPGLKGVTRMRSPAWIMNMISNPKEMTEKDPIARQLKAQLKGAEMKVPIVLSKKDTRDLLEYLRENDA